MSFVSVLGCLWCVLSGGEEASQTWGQGGVEGNECQIHHWMQSGGRAEKHSVKKMRETPPGERDVELSPWEPPTKPQRRARPSATKARHRLTLLPPGDFP